MAGATPGVHYPTTNYFYKVIRLAAHGTLWKELERAGYRVEKAVSEDQTMVAYIPVAPESPVPTEEDTSMWDQLALAAFMQRHWADNQVSCTVKFDPVIEGGELVNALNYYQYQLKGISFMPVHKNSLRKRIGLESLNGATSYPQMPYQAITEEEYHEATKNLKRVRFTSVKDEALGDKYCDSDRCVIV